MLIMVLCMHSIFCCLVAEVLFSLIYVIYLPCALISRYYSAMHNTINSFHGHLVSTYIKAIIRPLYDLDLTKKLYNILILTWERELIPLTYTGCFIMYFGITKIYYRKTTGHVFMKLVQIEGTTQKNFSQ
jgi:hypothetical protein